MKKQRQSWVDDVLLLGRCQQHLCYARSALRSIEARWGWRLRLDRGFGRETLGETDSLLEELKAASDAARSLRMRIEARSEKYNRLLAPGEARPSR